MIGLFWCSLGFLAYTFVGYPTLLWVLARRRNKVQERGDIWPKVSLIIATYNAGKIIRDKLQNSLQLDYPKDKFEIVVASDASTDETADVVRSFADRGVNLIELPRRLGKHHAQMVARDASHGEILVFTDASVFIEPCGLRKMVADFADSSVGCVSSEDVVEAKGNHGIGEGTYVQGEMGLRRLESRVSSAVSVSGSFWGARREVCEVWHPNLSSDFFVPLHAVVQGFRVVVDPECRARFGILPSAGAEFQRKVRTIVHGLEVLFCHLRLLNPFRYGMFSWQLASHKLFRWLLPYALMALLISNIFVRKAHPFYQMVLFLQLLGLGAGLLVLALERWVDFRQFKLAGFLLMSNAATVVAWLNYMLGVKHVIWEPSRRV